MRRGYPATHAVFGVSQTINTANFLMLKALRATDSLSTRTARIVLDKLLDGHLGQGLDLLWTYHTTVPTEEEYFLMVDGSTYYPQSYLATLTSSIQKPVAFSC